MPAGIKAILPEYIYPIGCTAPDFRTETGQAAVISPNRLTGWKG